MGYTVGFVALLPWGTLWGLWHFYHGVHSGVCGTLTMGFTVGFWYYLMGYTMGHCIVLKGSLWMCTFCNEEIGQLFVPVEFSHWFIVYSVLKYIEPILFIHLVSNFTSLELWCGSTTEIITIKFLSYTKTISVEEILQIFNFVVD